jgi:hypothetical protein
MRQLSPTWMPPTIFASAPMSTLSPILLCQPSLAMALTERPAEDRAAPQRIRFPAVPEGR